MNLGKKQELFSRLLPSLIMRAHYLGFEVRMGDVFRDPRVHGAHGELAARHVYGHRRSNHKLKLAVDLNLMRSGRLVTTTKGHKELGEWWEQQNEFCRWGGRFNDSNHYSLEHWGSM